MHDFTPFDTTTKLPIVPVTAPKTFSTLQKWQGKSLQHRQKLRSRSEASATLPFDLGHFNPKLDADDV
jgi:hypothetical protein